MSDLTGEMLDGRYRLNALLGEGGMGGVYRAHDLKLARTVAVKVMHPHLARQERFQQRFLQEAQAAARLSHPSIVSVHDFAQQGDLLYVVMELVQGGSLGNYLKALRKEEGAIHLREILYLLAQVADALGYAHEQGIVHRDVKPDNILLKRRPEPERAGEPPLRAVVTDFGLAKLVQGGIKTATGTFMGTLPYMSPEQALGNELDGRSDLYSLGVILYQLATGRLPLEINSPTDAVNKHLHESPPPPYQVKPGMPPKVAAVISKAIAKDPDERFASGRQMARALRAVADELTPADVTRFAPPQTVMSLVTRLAEGEPVGPPPTIEPVVPAAGVGDILLVTQGERTPQQIALDRASLTLGRSEDNDVVLPEQGVSRRHARLERKQKGWTIADLGSTNGTYLDGVKLLPDVPDPWHPDQQVRIGSYYLHWQPAPAEGTTAGRQALAQDTVQREQATRIEDQGEVLRAVLAPTEVSLTPGEETTLQVRLFNQGTQVAHYTVEPSGALPGAWVSLPREPVQLMPGESATLPVQVVPPRKSEARAGEYDFELAIVAESGESVETVRGTLTVAPFHAFAVQVHPTRLDHDEKTRVTIENEGNLEQAFAIVCQDPAGEVRFWGEDRLTVPPGEKQSTQLQLQANERPWLGRTQTMPFTVRAEPEGAGEGVVRQGQLDVPPRIPPALVGALLLLIPLLVAAGLFLPPVIAGDGTPTPQDEPIAAVVDDEEEGPEMPVVDLAATETRRAVLAAKERVQQAVVATETRQAEEEAARQTRQAADETREAEVEAAAQTRQAAEEEAAEVTRQVAEVEPPHAASAAAVFDDLRQTALVFDEQVEVFRVGAGEELVVDVMNAWWVAPPDVPPVGCANAFYAFTWMVRDPYPAGDELQFRRIIPMTDRTEVFAEGASGRATVGLCQELTLHNLSLTDYVVEIRYVSAMYP